MKSIYLREANAEKMRYNADKGYIQRMQVNADKNLEFTISVFKDTGRMLSVRDYVNNFNEVLEDNCRHVMRYIGGGYIQLMKDGSWLLDIDGNKETDKEIFSLEEKLYNHISKSI